jgi:hypothetical protein
MSEFRFVAFSTITGNGLVARASAEQARADAVSQHRLSDDRFIEVLDAGGDGRRLLQSVPLYEARRGCKTVFRGTGYDR